MCTFLFKSLFIDRFNKWLSSVYILYRAVYIVHNYKSIFSHDTVTENSLLPNSQSRHGRKSSQFFKLFYQWMLLDYVIKYITFIWLYILSTLSAINTYHYHFSFDLHNWETHSIKLERGAAPFRIDLDKKKYY